MVSRSEDARLIVFVSSLEQRLQFSRETESIEHVLQQIEHRVSTSGKAEVIGKQQDLLSSIQTISRKPISSFVTTPIPSDFPRSVPNE